VIMEHVALPTLKEVIKQAGTGLPPASVAELLAQVAEVASSVHQTVISEKGPALLIGPLRPSHIFYNANDRKIKISPLGISNATLQSCDSQPLLVLGEDELTSLAPERYAGERSAPATDQYYIGLLGLELLTGELPITVTCYGDLEKKKAFFDAPMSEFKKHREASPALFFVLARMLERRPENRWPSMLEVQKSLYRITEGKLPEKLRNDAIDTYKNLSRNAFYRDFYDRLFHIAPRAKDFFKNTNWEEQCRKLEEAVGVLLNFRPEDPQNLKMSSYAVRHRELEIQQEYFFAFRAAVTKGVIVLAAAGAPSVDGIVINAGFNERINERLAAA